MTGVHCLTDLVSWAHNQLWFPCTIKHVVPLCRVIPSELRVCFGVLVWWLPPHLNPGHSVRMAVVGFQGKNNLSFTNFCNFVAMSNEIQFVSGGKNVLLNINSINND